MGQIFMPDKPAKPYRIPRARIGLNVTTQIILAAIIVFLVNYLGFERFGRWDLSRNRKYTLSPLTRHVLGSLKKELKVYVFLSPNGNQSAGGELFGDIEALLKEYEYAGKRRVHVETVDPYRDLTRARELQDKYKFGPNDNQVILDYDGRQKSIPAATMADYGGSGLFEDQTQTVKDFRGEQVLTSALIQLVEERPTKIAVITGHGEPVVSEDADLSRFRSALEHQNFVIQDLSLEGLAKIPNDLVAVIVAGPQYDLNEQETNLLRHYWDDGGRLLVLLNGRAKTPVLDNFLNQLGVEPAIDLIVTTVKTGIEEESITLDVYGHFLNATPFLKPMADAVGFLPGGTRSIEVNESKLKALGIRATKALVPAIDTYWGEKDDFLANNADPAFHAGVDLKPPLVVGWALEKGAVEDQSIQVRSSSRMVVLGNADFIRDESLTRSAPDTNFLLLGMNWLTDRQTLLAIPPKENPIYMLDLRPGQMKEIVLIVVGGIPMLAAFLGIFVWAARRR